MNRILLLSVLLLDAYFTSPGQSLVSPFDFARADSLADVHRGASLGKLYELTYHLTSEFSTEEEKFRAIYTWVCKNIRNDYSTSIENERQRKIIGSNSDKLSAWNEKLKPEVYKRLLNRRLTVCTGYALLLREMALLAGIECRIVDGYGRTSHSNIGPPGFLNHTWNAVRLSGKWYLCDPTWSSGVVSSEKQMFFPDYEDGYFLASPMQFVQDHYPLDSAWLLMSNGPSLQEFLSRPLTYRGAYRYGIKDLDPGSLKLTVKKNMPMRISFSGEAGIEEKRFKILVRKGSSERLLNTKVTEETSGRYVLHPEFSFPTVYELHITVDDAPIASYEVRVTKK